MPPDVLANLLSYGGLGLLVWYLLREVQRLRRENERLRRETRKLLDERLKDVSDFSGILWQISKALEPVARYIAEQRRRSLLSDQAEVGSRNGGPDEGEGQ